MGMRECLKKVRGFLSGTTFSHQKNDRRTYRNEPRWHRLVLERLEDRLFPDAAVQAIAGDIQSILGPVEAGATTVQSSAQSLTSIPFVGNQINSVLSQWGSEI